MSKNTRILAAAALILAVSAPPVSADSGFHPLRTARAAAQLGLDTAEKAVDLGLETAEEAVELAEDIVDFDDCRPGAYYKDAEGRTHRCR